MLFRSEDAERNMMQLCQLIETESLQAQQKVNELSTQLELERRKTDEALEANNNYRSNIETIKGMYYVKNKYLCSLMAASLFVTLFICLTLTLFWSI